MTDFQTTQPNGSTAGMLLSQTSFSASELQKTVAAIGYGGDVSAPDAFAALADKALIVDVRTAAEWAFVGLPALTPEQLVLCEWQIFPDMQLNPEFVSLTGQEVLARSGGDNPADAPAVYFLCRSGARSRAAAMAMTGAGFPACFNIENGFEGVPDAQGHRGRVNGWKADDLPWRQS